MSKGKKRRRAGHELTAAAAAEILQDGGNAFDAALAGVFMTFVAEAVFASPGGGGFLMARRAGSDKPRACSISSPRRRSSAGRRARSSSSRSTPISARPSRSSISGSARAPRPAWCPACSPSTRRSARLPMKRLVEPAVRAARSGFPLSAFQAYLFTVIAPILTASESVARIFAPNGKPMTAGETFRNEELAEMPRMARRGRRASVRRWRRRPGHRGRVARPRRPAHPGRSQALSRRAARAALLAA